MVLQQEKHHYMILTQHYIIYSTICIGKEVAGAIFVCLCNGNNVTTTIFLPVAVFRCKKLFNISKRFFIDES